MPDHEWDDFAKNAVFRKITSEIDWCDEFLSYFFGKSCFFIGFFEKYSIFLGRCGFLCVFVVSNIYLCAQKGCRSSSGRKCTGFTVFRVHNSN